MSLNIKDEEAVRLASEVATLAGESKTRAVKVALQERRERLALTATPAARGEGLRRFLEQEAWPQIPAEVLGRPISRAEREAILGYGESGV
ncbi:MAG TPA: type II toxin-antitoxin system VapB family antitoxin [Solirubrobacteraceae bacterium]|jgi:antitoxin VapB